MCHLAGRVVVLALVVALAGCGPRVVKVEMGPPPPWVDVMPAHPGKLCALGYSGPTFYQTDCLKNAADNGRGHLSESISVTIRTITLDITDGTRGSYDMDVMVQGSESASESVLKGSEVESQWMDKFGQRGPENGCYAIVCIDPSKPIESLVDTLEEKKIPAKTVEKVRANAEAAFEELEKEEAKALEKKAPEPTPQPEPPPAKPEEPPPAAPAAPEPAPADGAAPPPATGQP